MSEAKRNKRVRHRAQSSGNISKNLSNQAATNNFPKLSSIHVIVSLSTHLRSCARATSLARNIDRTLNFVWNVRKKTYSQIIKIIIRISESNFITNDLSGFSFLVFKYSDKCFVSAEWFSDHYWFRSLPGPLPPISLKVRNAVVKRFIYQLIWRTKCFWFL